MNNQQLAADIRASRILAHMRIERGDVAWSRVGMVECVRCAAPDRDDHPDAYFAPIPVASLRPEHMARLACIIDVEDAR